MASCFCTSQFVSCWELNQQTLSLVWCSATEAAWECITSAAIYVLASLENVKAREKIGYKDLKDQLEYRKKGENKSFSILFSKLTCSECVVCIRTVWLRIRADFRIAIIVMFLRAGKKKVIVKQVHRMAHYYWYSWLNSQQTEVFPISLLFRLCERENPLVRIISPPPLPPATSDSQKCNNGSNYNHVNTVVRVWNIGMHEWMARTLKNGA